MPLYQISESVKRIQGPVKQPIPTVITSTGAYIPLEENLPDLDVLSAEECDNFVPSPPPAFEKQKEEEYYKGGAVDWWNFWYSHILRRTKLEDLRKLIGSALKGGADEEDQHVGRIGLYHQAGAGGSTLAMHALWDYRKSYRCAIVNSIPDPSQTAEQILQLRNYGEKNNPKPVIILLDNLDEEKSNFLPAHLEERAKQIARMDSKKLQVVCVLINCIRRNQLPTGHKNKRILLSHELDQRELSWFQKKSRDMEQEHANHLIGDPRLLISFNIMKENFDPRFMRKTVTDVLADITDGEERKLIKFVALLNAFDIQCKAIPMAAFDMMMTKTFWRPGLRYGKGAYAHRWESNLSKALKILLNVTSQVSMGYIHAIQIVSPLLSRHVLEAFQANDPLMQTSSDMAIEFFNTSNIFNYPSIARDNLLKIVKDILKYRAKGPNGLPETKFAPLIQEIVDKETVDKAGEVMEAGFELTRDPFVTQQLARLYIYASNWEKAKRFAKSATDTKSENSFLWDTYGRVYLGELMEHYRSIVTADEPLQREKCSTLMDCAFRGIDTFKRVQKLSLEERTSMTNNFAGHFGELEMIQTLLDCLCYVQAFHTKEDMKHFLVEPGLPVPEMEEPDNEACSKLKTLFDSAQTAITRLEDEHIQLREDHLDESKRNVHSMQTQKLNGLKKNLNPYFGEESDEAPAHLEEADQCKYRRRRLFQLGATSMLRIFDLKRKEHGEAKLNRIKAIVCRNINTEFEIADDIQVLMCVNLALLQISPGYLTEIVFEDMVNMSQRLYAKRLSRKFIHLEPHLFYVMFNWPQKVYHAPARPGTIRSVRPTAKPINHRMFSDALWKWREAYYAKYPKQRDEGKPYRKKDTTIFFFSNGSGMGSIISQDSLIEKGAEPKGESFWSQRKVQRELKRFAGVLCSDGDEVELPIEYPTGSKDIIKLPTSFPIRNRQMWNKRVYFVVGFSWKGPKAFHISSEDPTKDPAYMVADYKHFHAADARPKEPRPFMTGGADDAHEVEPHTVFLEKLSKCRQKLHRIKEIKEKKRTGMSLSTDEVCRYHVLVWVKFNVPILYDN